MRMLVIFVLLIISRIQLARKITAEMNIKRLDFQKRRNNVAEQLQKN